MDGSNGKKGGRGARTQMETSIRVQLYLTPAVPGERLLIEIWEAAGKARGRSQDVFRRALSLGLKQMCESGELEDDIVEDVGEERIMGRPRRRRQQAPAGQVFVLPPGLDPRFAQVPAGYGNGAAVLEAEPPPRRVPAAHRPLPLPAAPDRETEQPAVGPAGIGDLM